MGRTAYRIFRNSEFGTEASGDTIALFALRGCVLDPARKFCEQFLIRPHGVHLFFVFKHADKIKSEHRFERTDTKGLFHLIINRDFLQLIHRKIHLIQIVSAGDDKLSAHCIENDFFRIRIVIIEDHICACKRRMSAQFNCDSMILQILSFIST